MSARHQWRRRRRSAAPLVLAIVDHDTKRFTVEGCVENDEPWVTEVFRANRSGRKIDFLFIDENSMSSMVVADQRLAEYDEWPPKSIIRI
jgi:hypothetical protein